jgi:hypothetical protein
MFWGFSMHFAFESLSLLFLGAILVASVLYLIWKDTKKKEFAAAEVKPPSPVFARPQPLVEMGPPCLQSKGGWAPGGQYWALRSPILHHRQKLLMTPSSAKTMRVTTDEDRFLSSVILSSKNRVVVLDAVFDGHFGYGLCLIVVLEQGV